MCTVTIFPKNNNGFVLTSNRDEAPNRVSVVPEFYNVDNVKTLFPKDEQSGGTWIGVSEKNRLICVLNGGFKLHERKAAYRKSRGVVAKDFMVSTSILSTIKVYDLEGIEPFTMVIADWDRDLQFIELVWDGIEKHVSELPLEPKLWSSTTLYNEDMKAERQQWFKEFKTENELNAKSIMAFHKEGGGNNKDYGVVMNRGFVKTTSITQVEKQGDFIGMSYENLHDGTLANKRFSLQQIVNG
ncbi:NRDE family protein [Seonamhaeicola sp. MEBiC1930]|uniref:NRDE family protein n=1 Tax=Seonamhaeicola sp. MEBiC01930 TaxID=2976768 RepID=UPI0032457D27